MPEPTQVALAVGANLGDTAGSVASAMDAVGRLPNIRTLKRSSLYCSRAVGPPQPDYVNAAMTVETTLTPHALLDALQKLEKQLGRRVKSERWGPREIDLDIITFGDAVIDDERLTLPHPEAHHRCFVLAPLAEIAPTLVLAGDGSVADLLAGCDTGVAEKMNEADA